MEVISQVEIGKLMRGWIYMVFGENKIVAIN
jgi:hypothetical protein